MSHTLVQSTNVSEKHVASIFRADKVKSTPQNVGTYQPNYQNITS